MELLGIVLVGFLLNDFGGDDGLTPEFLTNGIAGLLVFRDLLGDDIACACNGIVCVLYVAFDVSLGSLFRIGVAL